MTITQQEIIDLAVEAGAIPASDGEYFPHELVICESMFETFAMAAYQRGVRDEREAFKSICEELEQHYSDYAATALLNGDVDLSNAASGEPRACRAMIDAIRARSAE